MVDIDRRSLKPATVPPALAMKAFRPVMDGPRVEGRIDAGSMEYVCEHPLDVLGLKTGTAVNVEHRTFLPSATGDLMRPDPRNRDAPLTTVTMNPAALSGPRTFASGVRGR